MLPYSVDVVLTLKYNVCIRSITDILDVSICICVCIDKLYICITIYLDVLMSCAYTLSEKVMEYLESILETLVFDISIYLK